MRNQFEVEEIIVKSILIIFNLTRLLYHLKKQILNLLIILKSSSLMLMIFIYSFYSFT